MQSLGAGHGGFTQAARRGKQALNAHNERTLNERYFPNSLEEAHDIIADLRDRLSALKESFTSREERHGMTPREWEIYSFLKVSGPKTRRALYTVFYGAEIACPESNSVEVMISKLRRKLPAGERIVAEYGQGYRWERVSLQSPKAARNTAPSSAP